MSQKQITPAKAKTIQRWRQSVNELVAFTTEHGRFPSETGLTDQERRLARLRRQAKKKPGHGARAIFDELMPGWDVDTPRSSIGRHRRMSAAVKNFQTQHHRNPTIASDDQGERSMTIWLRNNKDVAL